MSIWDPSTLSPSKPPPPPTTTKATSNRCFQRRFCISTFSDWRIVVGHAWKSLGCLELGRKWMSFLQRGPLPTSFFGIGAHHFTFFGVLFHPRQTHLFSAISIPNLYNEPGSPSHWSWTSHVGGWTNPFEKYYIIKMHQNASFPQFSGEKSNKNSWNHHLVLFSVESTGWKNLPQWSSSKKSRATRSYKTLLPSRLSSSTKLSFHSHDSKENINSSIQWSYLYAARLPNQDIILSIQFKLI